MTRREKSVEKSGSKKAVAPTKVGAHGSFGKMDSDLRRNDGLECKPTVGFIGLGIMGLAMARNASKAGFSVVAWNRSPARRAAALEAGLALLDTPADVATRADAVVVMVTDPAAVKQVLTAPKGVLSVDVKGKALIQMSTIDPDTTHAVRTLAEDKGMGFLDCPVAGSKKQVEEAQLILLAGGPAGLLKKWEPLLLSMGKAIVHAGDVGQGTALKLCMNLIVAQMTTALAEGAALARAQGLSPSKIFDVIDASPALNCGYYQIKKRAFIEGDFAPAFSLSNMLKDVRFADHVAKTARVALPVNQAVRFLMEAASAAGYGAEDLTSVAKILKPHTGGVH